MQNLTEDELCDHIDPYSLTKNFSDLFCKVKECSDVEQKHIIKEFHDKLDLLKEMDGGELRIIFSKGFIDELNKIINEKLIQFDLFVPILKLIGFYDETRSVGSGLHYTVLLESEITNRLSKEFSNKERTNEKQLIDLCECYILLSKFFSAELRSKCVSYLLKAALNKEDTEKDQKEVEIALVAVNSIYSFQEIKKDIYLNEITEIIKHHQENHNLTKLAYQSAWQFLVNRLRNEEGLKEIIVYELHFAREAAKELEDASSHVDWKKKKAKGIEKLKILIISRWVDAITTYFSLKKSIEDEDVSLIVCLVRMSRASKENYI
eukprot:MONOS_13124.1-p1 / transcript=MONOS_13124.1 / gene=MONOS_13124 / organism=Monocercomonoides_exilis_PA203 / gene_product=unspecified product / transcript_product=unspecified product / location=Mono_scaffold00781:648-1724(-) / protein_length=320 / sequence_SO=supercontig / SO=protein_coding / is_pseudo=false